MATKDFKVRNGLIVGGTLTLGGNVVSKVLDSDAVTAIAGSGSNVVHSIGGDSDQAFSKLDTQLNAAGTPVSIGDIAFVEGADSVAYVATGTPSVFTGSHSLTISSTAPSGDQRIVINGQKISPLSAITAAANSNTTSNVRLYGAALTASNTAAAFPVGNAGAFCGWQPTLTLNIPGEGSARTSVNCLVLMTPNGIPTWDGATYAFTATIAGFIPVSGTGSTTPTDIRGNFYSWTSGLTTTNISISQSGASYGLFPATLASSIAAQWTKISNNFDSDQIVTIINENTTAGSIDSDVAAVAQLRRDADSDSIRIQEIATSLEQINELVDSDLKAIADLRNDVDSDSIRIQDLQTQISSIGGLTDSDLKAVADLRNDVDSDSVKLQALQLSVDGLSGTAAINTTVYTYTATQGQTTFTGSDDNGLTLGYAPGKIYVFLNGILILDTTDYTATNGSSVVLQQAADSDNTLQVIKHVGTVQTGFDSDQVVAIINENVVSGSVDSDVAAIAQLRRDADSDSIRIQEIATSLEQINELVDSDLKAIADLRNDVDSDSAKLQALEGTVAGLGSGVTPNITEVTDSDGREGISSPNEGDLAIQYDSYAGAYTGISHDFTVNSARSQLWSYTVYARSSNSLTTDNGNGRFQWSNSTFDPVVQKGDVIVVENGFAQTSPGVNSGGVNYNSGYTGTFIFVCHTPQVGAAAPYYNIQAYGHTLSPSSIGFTLNSSLYSYFNNASNPRGDVPANAEVVRSYMNSNNSNATQLLQGTVAKLYRFFDPATYADGYDNNGTTDPYNGSNDATIVATPYSKPEVWVYQDSDDLTPAGWKSHFKSFDSDQIVAIINENPVAGTVDSDAAAIAQLRRDADSDSIRIQEIATSLEQINELVDSDLKAIADLRNDVDSDSIKIQALQETIAGIGGLTDSDLKAVADLRNDVDSDSAKLQALQVSVDGLAGTAAINTTVYTYTATQGQTTFTGTDANGLTLAYAPGKIYVFLNGVLILDTTDYTATNGTSIVLQEAADSDNTLQIIKHVGTVQIGFDSDQVVAIINENVVSGSVDSDVAAVAQLRRDADSDSIRIQEIATSLEQINELVDSDLKAIADLRNDIDSDSVAIQATKTDMDVNFTIVNSGSSAYAYTGDGFPSSVNNPTIYLNRGHTYNFRVNASGHPFQIRTTSGGSAYNSGVTNNGAQVGLVKFVVPMDAPESLVYQCTSHSGMVGSIKIGNADASIADSDLKAIADLRNDVDSDSVKLQSLQEAVNQLRAEQDSDSTNSGGSGGGAAGFDSDQVVAIINENTSSGSGSGMTDSDLKVVADLRNEVDALSSSGTFVQNASFTTYKYKTAQAQTVIGGVDRDNQTLSYIAGNINVFLNGVLLNDSDDYTATNGTQVVLGLAADSDDIVIIQKVASSLDSETVQSIWNDNYQALDISRFDFTAIQNQTTFTGADDNGATLSYFTNKVQVYLNGILLLRTTDYVDTSGTQIVLTQAADSDDKLSIIKYAGQVATEDLTITRFTYGFGDAGNGTVGTTDLSGADDNGNTLSYVVGKIQVFSNGVLLEDSDDYIANNGTSVILQQGADSDDKITILKYLGTTQSGFDSEQVVAIVNENTGSAGFDSDQVTTIVRETFTNLGNRNIQLGGAEKDSDILGYHVKILGNESNVDSEQNTFNLRNYVERKVCAVNSSATIAYIYYGGFANERAGAQYDRTTVFINWTGHQSSGAGTVFGKALHATIQNTTWTSGQAFAGSTHGSLPDFAITHDSSNERFIVSIGTSTSGWGTADVTIQVGRFAKQIEWLV